VVAESLGGYCDGLLRSAGFAPLPYSTRADLDEALGTWIPPMGVVVVDAGHRLYLELDDAGWEQMLARVAWHERGHALNVVRATEEDIEAGSRLLDLAPSGGSGFVRRGGYGTREYTHEVVAETFALLMSRRRRGQIGRPNWLAEDIYQLMRRVLGWSQ
jgi:hypothetical protein